GRRRCNARRASAPGRKRAAAALRQRPPISAGRYRRDSGLQAGRTSERAVGESEASRCPLVGRRGSGGGGGVVCLRLTLRGCAIGSVPVIENPALPLFLGPEQQGTR